MKGVWSGLFCEDYGTLKDRQISKIATEFPSWLGSLKDNRDQGLGFHFAEEYGGGVIALRNLDDPTKYKSVEFAMIAVDEITQNRGEELFHILRGSLRWHGIDDTRFICGTNPDGPGQKWVRRFWIERRFPDEMLPLADEFIFVQGLPKDNPYLSMQYWLDLNALPEKLRGSWRDGDWFQENEGLVYASFNNENFCYDDPDPDLPVELGYDDGYIDPRAILFIQRRRNGDIFVFDELYHSRHLEETCVGEVRQKMGEWFGWVDDDPEAGIPKKLPDIAIGSVEAPQLVKRFRAQNIPARSKPSHIVPGITKVRGLIKDGNGYRALKVHPTRCTNFVKELMEGYMYPKGSASSSAETPLDEDNHACDAFRYWANLRVR